jgi:hypothetical protein
VTDTYSVVPGYGNEPGLPAINLPSFGPPTPRGPTRITVGRAPPAAAEARSVPAWEDEPEPGAAEKPAAGVKPAWEDEPEPSGKPSEPVPTVGAGEAAATGALQGLTFGAQPAIAGLTEAAGEPGRKLVEQEAQALEWNPMAGEFAGYAGVARPLLGAARLAHESFSDHPDPAVKEAYHRGREAALRQRDEAYEAHPYAYMGGMMAGTLFTPSFGAGAPATLGARAIQGARAGGIGAGLYGIGTGVSEGKTAQEIAQELPADVTTGAVLGGTFGTALGPRTAPTGRGAAAAQTARDVGANLPRGYASESRGVRAATGAASSLPLVGPRIAGKTEQAGERAGERVGDIAGETGVPFVAGRPERAATAGRVSPALEQAVERGRQVINNLYDGVRGRITPDREFPMPRLGATLNRLEYERIAAGWPNPGQGFEQFRRLEQRGASFNGAHRARMDARDAGNVTTPHPGYNAADYNQIARAITEDLRTNVQDAALNQTPAGRAQALRSFMQAEASFGPISEFNQRLTQLARQGAGGLSQILGAAGERSSDLPLLQHLRRAMPPDEFQMLGGLLASELGFNRSIGAFSLAQFATNWAGLGQQAKRVMFSPEHFQQLDNIAEMGRWLKEATRDASKSHSSNWYAYLLAGTEVLGDIGALAHDLYSTGTIGPMTLAGVGVNAITGGVAWMLGNNARAGAVRNWFNAYRAMGLSPTPARTAAFNIATRNLANTLGIPVERLTQTIAERMRAQPESNGAQPTQPNKNQERAPVGR